MPCNEIIIQLGNGNTVKIELGDLMWGNQGSDTMNGSNCVLT